jgi:hypothetical protein
MAGRRNAIVEKVTDAPEPSNPIIARKQTVTSVRVLRARLLFRHKVRKTIGVGTAQQSRR